MANTKKYKPGQTATFSGEAKLVGPRGGVKKHEVTVEKGKKFPPTPQSGDSYIKSRGAHNKRGRGK